jgi:hypothetical protein
MSHQDKYFSEIQPTSAEEKGKLRKPYQKPQLADLGDLRTLTLGVSPAGFLDSGGALYSETFIPPPTPDW